MARRPQFDRSEVLTKAMNLFWERGYNAVSVSDLVEATGLLPGSLYASFGNKEGMFLAALQHYSDGADTLRAEFETEESPLAVVRNFFTTMTEQAASGEDRRGCFLVNASLECSEADSAIKTQVQGCLGKGEAWLQEQFEAARQVGELREDTDTAQLAGCVMSSMFGLRIMSRANEGSDKIRSIAAASFESLIAPWQRVAA